MTSGKELNKATLEVMSNRMVKTQKEMTHLVEKFYEMSEDVEKLIVIIQSTAKNFMYQMAMPLEGKSVKENEEFFKKLDSLIEQNKKIEDNLKTLKSNF